MAVIVYNKRTGKYLKRHSGSYNAFVRNAQYKAQDKYGLTFRDSLERPPEERNRLIREVEEIVFSAGPSEARLFSTEGTATGSVGRWIKNPVPEVKKGRKIFGHYELPDHLECHEVKESFVCVIRPDGTSNCDEDGSEKTK